MRRRRSPQSRSDRSPNLASPIVRDNVHYEILETDAPNHEHREPAPPPARLIRLPEVMKRVGLRRAAIYKLMAERRFPQPVKLGTRAVGWVESEIQEWIKRRIDARQSTP